MLLYPAMDFIEDRCVRLYQGQRELVSYYDYSPADWAVACEKAGAPRLHLVDLDGAFSGTGQNLDKLREIRAAVSLPIQIGGGIRSLEQALQLIDEGFDVILGTMLLKDPETAKKLASTCPDRLVAALDCKDGWVTAEGWVESSTLQAAAFIKTLLEWGFRRFVYTDISKDGTLAGPNQASLQALLALKAVTGIQFELVASGGVGTLDDLAALKALGADGAIVGRALLSGTFELKPALALCKGGVPC